MNHQGSANHSEHTLTLQVPIGPDAGGHQPLCLERWLVMPLLALLLAACSSSTPPSSESRGSADTAPVANAGRYAIDQDRPPSRPLDPGSIREVVPVPVTRTLAGNYSPYTVNGRTYTVMDSEAGYEETGLASWYGEKFHGHRTSNGEIFDMYQVSAAHRSLPIPGYVRVTNLENSRSLVVRVNDRGPFHSDRVIDLSYAAAWQLGFADQGTARVHVQAIVPDRNTPAPERSRGPTLADAGGSVLQVGAFSDRAAAERIRQRVQSMTDQPVFIRSVAMEDTGRRLHRVRVGPITDSVELERISSSLQNTELGRPYMVQEANR